MDDLNSVLNEQTETETGEEVQTEALEQETTEGNEPTGEQEIAPPAVEQEEDEGTKRIKGLEAAAAAERRKRQQLEQQLAELMAQRQQTEQPKPQTQQQPADEPKRDDFASDADYFRALARHEAQMLREAERAEERQRQEQREQQERLAARQAALDDVVKKGQKRFADFDATINSGLAPFLTPVLQDALLHLDRPDEVAYWLAQNPADAEKVTQLSPAKMLTRLAAIEVTKLGEEPTAQRQSIPQTLTQQRNAAGQFQKAYAGPTPLDDILARKT